MSCVCNWILMVVMSSMGLATQAYIFEVYSIRKSDPATNGPEWVIGLGDLHDKKHPITHAQKNEILRFLSTSILT